MEDRQEANGLNQTEILVEGLNFPESPRWVDGRLWFSDMRNHRVCVLDGDGDVATQVELDDAPSGLGFLDDGRLLVVSMYERVVLQVRDGVTSVYADLSPLLSRPQDFLNDMLVTPSGDLFVGTRTPGLDPRNPGEATDQLVYVPPFANGAPRVVAGSFSGVNGLALVGNKLVAAETYGARLTALTRGPSGGLSGREVFARLPGLFPDGICSDREGGIWLGSAFTGEIVRVGRSGVVTDRVQPTRGNAIACALGGEDGRSLYISCADASAMGPARSAHDAAPASDRVPVDSGTIQRLRVRIPGW